jgi:predicted permease
VVLGYAFWKSRLGGDPGIVGQKASINGYPVTVIGVAPQEFHGVTNLVDTQAFVPLGLARSLEGANSGNQFTDRDMQHVLAIGRLKEGADLEKAQSVLAVVASRLAAEYPKGHEGLMLRPVALGAGFVNPSGQNPVPIAVGLFMILAGVVLILAATNLANLLLVKAVSRNREMAVRSALGAVRMRLARQVFTETLLLALLGCAAGVALGYFGSRAAAAVPLQTGIPIVLDFHFDWRVFSYALAAALAVALVGGLVPAWRASGADLNQVLREAARKASPRHQRLRTILVVSQLAGSLMLLIVAGLFVRSLQSVRHADLGFDPEQVVNFSMDAHGAGYDEAQGRQFYQQLLERIRTAPGVKSASLAQTVPLGMDHQGAELKIEGYQPLSTQGKPAAGYNAVSPGYFATMRIPILRGRDVLDSDNAGAPHGADQSGHGRTLLAW